MNGSTQSVTYPSVPGTADRRTITYTADNAGRLSSLSAAATSYAPIASASGISYSANGTVSSETYGNSLIHAVTYNSRLQRIGIKLGTAGNPTSVVSIAYDYGSTANNGNVQSSTYSGGGLSYSQSFGYDSLNRLTTANENGGANWSQTNGYDRYGNRWIDLGGGNQSLYFTAGNNRISGASYDATGNLLNDGTHTYSFNAENKIAKVDNIDAYVYDGEGLRVRKLIGENLRFVYGIGGQLIMEFSGSMGALTKEYVYGADGLLATIEPTALNSNGARYTTADHLGSPRVVTNAVASVVSRHDYMPFGEEIGSGVGGRTTGIGFPGTSDGLRQKFTLKERDIETGLDYFLARYYSSPQGRFTSPDEFTGGPEEIGVLGSGHPEQQALKYAEVTNPQSLNKYQYAFNNPLRYVDPDGQTPQEGADLRQRQDIKDLMEHRITEKEYWERQNARATGAAIGAALVAVALAGKEIGATILFWMAANPDKVEQIAQVTQEALGGPPAMITGVTRMTKAELSMAEYLASNGQNVEKLAVSTVQGVRTADFAVNGVAAELKTLGAQAGANTLKNDIAHAVGQGRGSVLIDARDAARITAVDAQRAAARVFGADSRLKVVRVVGKDFDVTIARQSH